MIRKLCLLSALMYFVFLSCSPKSTEPSPTVMTLTSPVGGETWLVGGSVDMTWTSENAGTTVKIELSRDNGETWDILVQEAENNGLFIWTVTGPESETCFVKVTDVAGTVSAGHEIPLTIKGLEKLGVSFFLDYIAEPYPSYQTTIWLEDEQGHFLHTIFISDWLSRGGYAHKNVCSTWSSKANWSEGDTEELDGITGATPEWGVDSHYLFDMSGRDLKPGLYTFNLESHITGEYNILYTGHIELGDKENSVEPSPQFIPAKHEQAGEMLHSVKMEYRVAQE